jgi:hypothetical protein
MGQPGKSDFTVRRSRLHINLGRSLVFILWYKKHTHCQNPSQIPQTTTPVTLSSSPCAAAGAAAPLHWPGLSSTLPWSNRLGRSAPPPAPSSPLRRSSEPVAQNWWPIACGASPIGDPPSRPCPVQLGAIVGVEGEHGQPCPWRSALLCLFF